MMGSMALALIALIVLAAALAAAVGVALRNQRAGVTRRRDPGIDPFTVGEPWRRLVQKALRAQARYRDTVAALPPGPMHDRLVDIRAQVDAAVAESWRVARRGNDLRGVLDGMAIARTREELATIAATDEDPSVVERADSLRSRAATYDRIAAATTDAEEHLRLLVARLEEASARSTELSITTSDSGLAALDTDVSGVVDELEALRLALDEVGPRRELGR
jgi:hypothetical protein